MTAHEMKAKTFMNADLDLTVEVDGPTVLLTLEEDGPMGFEVMAARLNADQVQELAAALLNALGDVDK